MVSSKRSFQLLLLSGFVMTGAAACNNSDLATQESCTVVQTASGTDISCPNGTNATINNGATGATGAQGLGTGMTATQIPAGDSRCLQGNGGVQYRTFTDVANNGIYNADIDTVTSTNYLCNGATGSTGAVGATGATGAAGASSVTSLTTADSTTCPTGGWIVTVTNGTQVAGSYPLCNGATGATGSAGAVGATGATGATGAAGADAPVAPLSLVQLIAPCGEASSAWKEELMLFSDGSILADFSESASGQDTRLSFIPDGSYIDTDESGCTFTVSTSGSTRSVSWGAGSSSNDPSGWAAGSTSWTVAN